MDLKQKKLSRNKQQVTLEQLKKQFQQMASSYQAIIGDLCLQNTTFRNSLKQYQSTQMVSNNNLFSNSSAFLSPKKSKLRNESKQLKNTSTALKSKLPFDYMATAKSQFFQNESQKKQLFTPLYQDFTLQSAFRRSNSPNKRTIPSNLQIQSKIMQRSTNSPSPYVSNKITASNSFPVQLISDQNVMRQSRFQVSKQARRKKQNMFVDRLEAAQKNLAINTNRFFSLVGKASKVQNQQVALEEQNKSSGRSVVSLNKSLNSICNSLDNSFASKKRRIQKKKQQVLQRNEIQRRRQQEEKLLQGGKQRGMKNLLSQLRANARSSPHKAPQLIKQSKLITCGEKTKSKNTKVMINPVAVDVVKRDKARNKSPASPTRVPTSILKQPSAILTRSLSGISAIQLEQ